MPPTSLEIHTQIYMNATNPNAFFSSQLLQPNEMNASVQPTSHLIIPTPLPHRQPLDAIALGAPRPLPRAETRPAAEAHGGAPLDGRLSLCVQLPAEQQAHGGPGGGDVDDRVPEAHQGQDDAGGVGEGQGDKGRVDEGVDAIDR